MAEGILRSKLSALGRTDIAVASMGIHAPRGQSASREAVEVCAEKNVDIAGHVTRPLAFDELKAADYVFVMENFQKDFLRTFVPQVDDRLFLLGEWPGNQKNGREIPDPIGGTRYDYQNIFGLIASHIDRFMPFLLAECSR